LNGIHELALENLEKCEKNGSVEKSGNASEKIEHVLRFSQNNLVGELPLAPIEFSCGSFEDPYEYIGDADVVFVFSSCMSEEMMGKLSRAFGLKCKPGTIIIITDYELPLEGYIDTVAGNPDLISGDYKHKLLENIDGWCWITGGDSTAYIYQVVESLWFDGGILERPEITLDEE